MVFNTGVSCVFNGFLSNLFLGHSLLRRDQVNLPSFQEKLAAWHKATLQVLPVLDFTVASWVFVGNQRGGRQFHHLRKHKCVEEGGERR